MRVRVRDKRKKHTSPRFRENKVRPNSARQSDLSKSRSVSLLSIEIRSSNSVVGLRKSIIKQEEKKSIMNSCEIKKYQQNRFDAKS